MSEEEKIQKIVDDRKIVREVRKCIKDGETDPRMILCTIRKYVLGWANEEDIKKALKKSLGKKTDMIDPRKILKPSTDDMQKEVARMISIFGSKNKA